MSASPESSIPSLAGPLRRAHDPPESSIPSSRSSRSTPYDLAVIGGGITGAGVARDAALRGLRVILFEKEDFASGTTGRNLKMIHGGPRYLEYAPHVTKESCEESAIIQRIAPDVVFRVPFMRVVMPGDTRELRDLDAFFSEYDRFHVLKNGVKHCVLTGEEARRVEPRLSREVTGAVSFDEFAAHPQRLTWLNLMDARAHGAVLHNHAPVTGFRVEGGRITAVKVRLEGSERDVPVKAVVNATGPWADKVAKLAGLEVPLRPTRGTIVFFDRVLSKLGIFCQAIDGREVAVVPHFGETMLGWTDEDHFGSPDDVKPTEDEVNYLLASAARAMPGLEHERMVRAIAGVRPLVYAWGVPESAITRDLEVVTHERQGVANLVSATGGKMVTYRAVAEQAVDRVARLLGLRTTCTTAETPLPRDPWIAERLEPKADLLCACENLGAATLHRAATQEMAMTVEDVARRSQLGWGPCHGAACAMASSALLARELSAAPASAMGDVMRFLNRRFDEERFALGRGQEAAAELVQNLVTFTLRPNRGARP